MGLADKALSAALERATKSVYEKGLQKQVARTAAKSAGVDVVDAGTKVAREAANSARVTPNLAAVPLAAGSPDGGGSLMDRAIGYAASIANPLGSLEGREIANVDEAALAKAPLKPKKP